MNNQINILFLGGAKRVSLAERFIEAGYQLDHTINIFSYELDKYVPISSIAKIIIGLKWNDDNLLKHLNEVIEQNKIDIVLPFVDPATIVAAELKSSNKDVFIPVSDLTTMKIFFDKLKSNNWFKEVGLNLPLANDGEFPLIAKPIFGSASKGLKIINNQADFELFKKDDNPENYLIQKYINGDEFTVDCYISKNNNLIAAVPRKRIEITGGEVTKAITVRDEKILTEVKKIIDTGIFRGPINIQFIRDNTTGETYIMEINPRFGGGVPLTIEAGANFPLFLIKEYLNYNDIEPIVNWKENLVMARSFRETFIYANNN